MRHESHVYFAYGSNLSTARLRRRVPSARRHRVGFVHDYDVVFTKQGQDGSAKATLTTAPGRRAHGCVFMMDAHHKVDLDRVEGLGVGYEEHIVRVEIDDGDVVEAFTYVATSTHIDDGLRPFDWYAALVEHGAREHGLPGSVTERYAAIETVADHDLARAERHWALVHEGARRVKRER